MVNDSEIKPRKRKGEMTFVTAWILNETAEKLEVEVFDKHTARSIPDWVRVAVEEKIARDENKNVIAVETKELQS